MRQVTLPVPQPVDESSWALSIGEQTVIGEVRRYGITTALPPIRRFTSAPRAEALEIIAAYSAFANLGTRVEPIGIQRIEDREGTIRRQSRAQASCDPDNTALLCAPWTGRWSPRGPRCAESRSARRACRDSRRRVGRR